jgi:dienelactone hydrolase
MHKNHTDPARIGAIGYCFGGTTALELARSGADIEVLRK